MYIRLDGEKKIPANYLRENDAIPVWEENYINNKKQSPKHHTHTHSQGNSIRMMIFKGDKVSKGSWSMKKDVTALERERNSKETTKISSWVNLSLSK